MSLEDAILKSPLILDGAMGTMLSHYLGKLASIDEVTLHSPKEVERIHQAYSDAGADILKTNTFNNSPHTKEAVLLAKNAITRKDQFVAGVIGPVFYETSLEQIIDSFEESHTDVFLLETCMSLKETAKRIELIKKKSTLPLMVSMTVTKDGQALSGESVQHFYDVVSQYNLFSFGINCSFGPESITPVVNSLHNTKKIPLSAHPNLSDRESFFDEIKKWKRENLFQIIGGCCGTTPNDIQKIKELYSLGQVEQD